MTHVPQPESAKIDASKDGVFQLQAEEKWARELIEGKIRPYTETINMKQHTLLSLCLVLFCFGCSIRSEKISSTNKPLVSKSSQDVQTLTLQYRISMDAVAPSKFVALYEDGMTLGLKIHWKLNPADRQELDAFIAQLEAEKINGQEFIVRARWIHEGYELEVYDIEKKS